MQNEITVLLCINFFVKNRHSNLIPVPPLDDSYIVVGVWQWYVVTFIGLSVCVENIYSAQRSTEHFSKLDIDTVNGTFIGDKRILPDREILLKPDDDIGIGCAAGELGKCTLKVEHSSNKTPSNEDNEVVSTTNDSDSDQNLLNRPEDDEYHDANQSCEELQERMHCTEFPAPPQRNAKELEKRCLTPPSTVSEPADPSQSSSRQPKTSSFPQVKSEPSISSPVKKTNIPNRSSPQTTNVLVQQPPSDDINASGLEPSVVTALSGAGISHDVIKTAFHSMMQQFLAEKLAGSNILPSLLNLSNQNAAPSPESSTSQTSNTSTNVKEEPSANASSHPLSLAASASVRRRVKSDSKKSNVTLVDVPADPAVATAQMECPKVDLSKELENDLMEITDMPPVALATKNEAVDKVSRRKSNNDVNELTNKRPTSHKPIAKSSRDDETDKWKSGEAIINLCDTNECADDVIEISDEESGSQPRRSRQNRKIVDPNTIVIEDTGDDKEKSKNLEPCSDKPVLTTAPAPAKPALSSEPKVDFSKQIVLDCVHKVEVQQPVLTTSVEPPPSNQPKAGLHQPNVSAPVMHSSSNRLKVELPEPIELDPVEDTPCNMQQMQFAPATVTTPVEPPPSDGQNTLFQQPIINTLKVNPSIDKPISGLPQSKVEPSSKPDVALQKPVSDAPAESSLGIKETVSLENVNPTKSLLTDVPSISSFTELCEDRKPSALVKREPVAPGNYSNLDEIIALDSDDEDFPLSQLNTTLINDVPDFSSSFERMFDDGEYVKEEPQMLQCNENTWFEPFSQTEMVEGKHVARIQLSTLESDDAMTEKELQSILGEEPDEADDKMDVDEEPSLSKPSADVYDFDVNQQPQSSDWCSVVKRKYRLKDCSIRLTDAKPLTNRWSRKAQKEEEEEKRRSSPSFDEAQRGLNEESVKDATTKKRRAQPSPHKVKKRKRRSLSPTMTLQEKRRIKEKRKEKLKKIVPKTNETETKLKGAFRPDAKPVVKVTDKNRGSFLIDAMVKEAPLPKRPLKVEHSTKEPSLPKRDKPSKSEPSTSSHHIHPEEGAQRLPVIKKKAMPSNNLKSNDAKLLENILDRYCKDDAKPGPSRIGSICEPKENAFINAISRVTYEAKKELDTRKDSESQRKSSNSSASRHDSHNYQKFKSADVSSQSRKPKKSSLKKTPLVYRPANIYDPPKPKKKVRFHREEDCQIIPWDALERRNNGIFAPAYKLNENLIREGVTEFETAMAKVCSWNVKWLEEQQKSFNPPPLYPESGQVALNSTLAVKYKEELKHIMFNNLWQAIFRSWNKPDNDFLPHTQFINEKTSLSTLMIESVDTTKGDKKMWTIVATRTVPADDEDNDLSTGQVVILNFPILTQPVGGVPRKTMVFGYLAAITKTNTLDKESINQRMLFRISAKPFRVVLGEAKLKVLSYLKSSLRPFQALAMITRSPMTDLIIDPDKKFFFDPVFDASGDWFHDKFLDPSQRRAVANCLNCILSPEPSLCLVDGAPATGKSQVIVSLMRELFLKHNRNRFPNDLRVLIVTAQDVVADDLSYRLEGLNKKEKSFNFLRYGNYRGMHTMVKNCTLDKKIQDLLIEDHGNKLINLEEEKNNLKAKIHSIKLVLDSTSAKPEKITEAKIKLTNNEREWNDMESENSKVIEQLKSQVAKEISIESADIILTSVYSCWTSSFEHDFVPTHYNKGDIHKFTVCIFDDASLINETAMLLPMMLMVRSLILVGDHRNQIIISKDKSPFFRLLNACAKKAPSAVTELNFQYRSPPHIMHWVDEFYNINCKSRTIPPPVSKLKIKSLFVFDLIVPAEDEIKFVLDEFTRHFNSACTFLAESVSEEMVLEFSELYFYRSLVEMGNLTILSQNAEEIICFEIVVTSYRYEIQASFCSLLVEKLNQLVEDANVKFGIIVAQSSQKDIIKSSRGLFERGRKVIVETLDEFSGREHDVVILCLPYHCMQYASWLYVAVTRARYSLFVCGDFAQLEDQKCVSSLTKFACSRKLYSRLSAFESDIPTSLIQSS